jgi:hypothetical protein
MTGVAAGILFVLSSWLERMIIEKHTDEVQVAHEL